jgi:hypothetical protein
MAAAAKAWLLVVTGLCVHRPNPSKHAARRYESPLGVGGALLQPIGSGKTDDITCLVVVVPHAWPTGSESAGSSGGGAGRAVVGDEAAASPDAAPAAADADLELPGPPAWRQPGVLTWDRMSRVSGAAAASAVAMATPPAPRAADADDDKGVCTPASASLQAASLVEGGSEGGGAQWAVAEADQDCGWGAVEAQWAAVEEQGGWSAAAEATEGQQTPGWPAASGHVPSCSSDLAGWEQQSDWEQGAAAGATGPLDVAGPLAPVWGDAGWEDPSPPAGSAPAAEASRADGGCRNCHCGSSGCAAAAEVERLTALVAALQARVADLEAGQGTALPGA